MSAAIKAAAVLVICLSPSSSMRCAKTNHEGPQSNKSCVFPFIFQNASYNECTRNHDKFGQLWCSTKTDENHFHFSEQDEWGYCDYDCEEVTERAPLRCNWTNLEGMQKKKKCVFPFVYENASNTACVKEEGSDKFWCSTNVTEEGVHIKGEWGYCDPECNRFNTECKTYENEDCIFPFTYKNKTYHSCTYDYSGRFTSLGAWCSLKTDENGHHVVDEVNFSTFGVCRDECPIPPRYCGQPAVVNSGVTDKADVRAIDIEQQPWIASLGTYVSRAVWNHTCTGSIITPRHVLTAARCLVAFIQDRSLLKRYMLRLGVSDLSSIQGFEGVERKIADVFVHPDHRNAYFDVGIAVADRFIEFDRTVLPICLPFYSVDYDDQFKDQFAVVAGWEERPNSPPRLQLYNMQVLPSDECKNRFSEEGFQKSGLPPLELEGELPHGIAHEHACLETGSLAERSCQSSPGSPAILPVSGSFRGEYFEQHLMLVSGFSCNHSSMVYVRISAQNILTWIQQVTETTPVLMAYLGNTRVNQDYQDYQDVEIISNRPDDVERCFTEIEAVDVTEENFNPIEHPTGLFTKHAVIVCGGNYKSGRTNRCHEYFQTNNSWLEINSTESARYASSSTIDEDGNLWIIGGDAKRNFNANYSEVYDYQPLGKGTWKRNDNLPSELSKTSISDTCIVRINSTHKFMVGGYLQPFRLVDDFDPTADASIDDDYFPGGGRDPGKGFGGGSRTNRAWIFDGKTWTETKPMASQRDFPSCSLIKLQNGELGVIVASGCHDWCSSGRKASVATKTEIYNLQTGEWSEVADFPFEISLGKMATLDGVPTFVAGFDEVNQEATDAVYQYHADEARWVKNEQLTLRVPRNSHGLMEIPYDLFGIC